MPINFPNNPTAQVPTNEFSPTSTPLNTENGVTYIWDGEKWVASSLVLTGEYVKIAGDNMTGNLTLGTDKITLNATDGSAEFANKVTSASTEDTDPGETLVTKDYVDSNSGDSYWDRTGTVLSPVNAGDDVVGNNYVLAGTQGLGVSGAFAGSQLGPGGTVQTCAVNSGIDVWQARTLGSSNLTSRIFADGSASFSVLNNGSTDDSSGIKLNASGSIFCGRPGVDTAFAAFNTDSTNGSIGERFLVRNTGDTFIGGTIPSAPNITLNANGSATFAGGIVDAYVISKMPAGKDAANWGCFNAELPDGTQTANINADGSAKFATGNIKLYANGGGQFKANVELAEVNPTSVGDFGFRVLYGVDAPNNTTYLGTRFGGENQAFAHVESSTLKAAISLDGSAEFTNNVAVSGTGFASVDVKTGRTGDGENIGGLRLLNSTGTSVANVYGHVGGKLTFETNGNERVRIDQTGSMMLGDEYVSGEIVTPKISLNANGSAQFAGPVSVGGTADANKMSEYEEGTWTPEIGNWFANKTNEGKYTKIGNVVTICGRMIVECIDYSPANASVTFNLPFPIDAGNGGGFPLTIQEAGPEFGAATGSSNNQKVYMALKPTGFTTPYPLINCGLVSTTYYPSGTDVTILFNFSYTTSS